MLFIVENSEARLHPAQTQRGRPVGEVRGVLPGWLAAVDPESVVCFDNEY